ITQGNATIKIAWIRIATSIAKTIQTVNSLVSKEYFCQTFHELFLFRDFVDDDLTDMARLADEKWTSLDLQSYGFHSLEKTNNNAPIT
ncbi:hypothetical protein BGZ80_007749, partial [Entomortierella chlamydospora]